MRSQTKTRRPRPTERPSGGKAPGPLGLYLAGCETTAKHVRSIKKEATRQPATAFLRILTHTHRNGPVQRQSPPVVTGRGFVFAQAIINAGR
jgi:hypothetical protein